MRRLPSGYVLCGDRAVPLTATAPRPAIAPANVAPPPLPAYLARRLRPEERLQATTIRTFRPRLVPGARLTPLNGEQRGGRGGKDRRYLNDQIIRRALGYEVGTPDLEAYRPGLLGFIELKRPPVPAGLLAKRRAGGTLSPEQRAWREWALAHGYPWAKCDTLELIETTLLDWGIIN